MPPHIVTIASLIRIYSIRPEATLIKRKSCSRSGDIQLMMAKWLQAEMERQAREKYISGEYELGKLNAFGQRINIVIEIPRKDKEGTVTFVSGWMVEPNGKLKLNTPYGGK